MSLEFYTDEEKMLLSCFLEVVFDYIYLRQNISFFVCAWMKTSSKCTFWPRNDVMTILLRMSGRKILLINAENAAGPMEIPLKKLFNSYC